MIVVGEYSDMTLFTNVSMTLFVIVTGADWYMLSLLLIANNTTGRYTPWTYL